MKAGEEAGRSAGLAAVAEEAARLQKAANSLDESFANLDQEIAEELLALALEVSRQVLRVELSARPDIVMQVITEALEQLPHTHAVIYLNPGDAALVRKHMGDNLAHSGHRIEEDRQLKPGDCLLESGGSVLDATIATRWRRVLESIGAQDAWRLPDKP